MKLKGRLRLDLGLKGRYFEIETIVFTIDSKETQYCADKPIRLKFGLGIANRWQRNEARKIRGDLSSYYF